MPTMTIGELIKELQRLPSDWEVALLTSNAHARPPSIVRVNQDAWAGGKSLGLRNPRQAYLLRPQQEII